MSDRQIKTFRHKDRLTDRRNNEKAQQQNKRKLQKKQREYEKKIKTLNRIFSDTKQKAKS